ncbi:YqhV family protein [Alicyclobacillus cycloheptanicus]|jgi:hypothetical protein|uniref:ABC-type multidrug transport system permease subunit n=1 Tax=Alicyclobacillus cycloheptanicus TaxID=1457 RepID=A0ABT9XDH0_9BACL|nr:YqhV family protein [Alicyclobacillus cycloheptanicus]MDQ0188347.1 ABC-type multidrug transport system permease subunit [Alicyclobacillus cycloheptanicus]WDM01058.1 YqhV family protein [Alicyclobacillus cycloheptanicus]
MFEIEDKVVYAMASLRFLSSCVECLGAVLMLYFGTAHKALQVNGALALVGPFVLVTVTFLGIAGMAGQVPWWKIGLIVVGVGCILTGARG